MTAGSEFLKAEGDHTQNVSKRGFKVYVLAIVVIAIEMLAVFYQSGYIKGFNKVADNYKKAAIEEANGSTIASGDIYDRNRKMLVENARPMGSGKFAHDYAYSQVIGYTGPATVVYDKTISSSRRDYRLMKYYRSELYKPADHDGTKGNSLTLTLDHKLQMKVYEIMSGKMNQDSDIGSTVVLDAKTGEVLAMVSFPTFDVNQINKGLETMQSAPEELEIYYPMATKNGKVPGSIFKIVTATCLLDNDMEDLQVEDTGFMVDDRSIVNAYGNMGDVIGYHDAIVRSSNVFFAQAALKLGAEKLTETAKKFMIGEEVQFDFGTVVSNWKLDGENPVELAHTGFGQGKTLYSTMYGAMTVQAIANDGVMLEPYMVKEITNAKGKVQETGKTKVLSEVTTKSTANKITNAMVDTTEKHFTHLSQDAVALCKRYGVAAKTGTGEVGDEQDTNNAWVISFAPADNPRYVVVMNHCKVKKSGSELMEPVMDVYRYLLEGE